MLWRFLSSLKLTIPLLLGLALVAIFGTLKPVEFARYELFYQSLWFRLLLGLLAVNLTVCTVRTLRRQWGGVDELFDVLSSGRRGLSSHVRVLPVGATLDELTDRFSRIGYRVETRQKLILAHRGRFGRWGSTVVHFSLLLIMFGALLGGVGFVGTKQLYVGHSTENYFDWDAGQDRPLGFEFRLDYFEPIYYPIHVRLVIHDADSGKLISTLTAYEGDVVALPVPGCTAHLKKFIPIEKRLVLSLFRENTFVGDYDAYPVGNKEASAAVSGVTIHPDAFQDPLLKQLHSEVSILREGQVVKRGVIEVNHPLVYEGVTIYQTAFDQDQFGYWYAGFQLSRDPGESLVWAGCVMLILGFVLAFVVRPRVLGVAVEGDRLVLASLRGFVGEEGTLAFDELLNSLC